MAKNNPVHTLVITRPVGNIPRPMPGTSNSKVAISMFVSWVLTSEVVILYGELASLAK